MPLLAMNATQTVVVVLLLLPTIALGGGGGGGSSPVLVNTSDCGLVAGTLTEPVESFVGIPYASAPLRWQESRPLPELGRCWAGTLHPKPPPACIQMLPISLLGPTSEDCLTLNVFRPNSTSGSLPVLVYFHGGDLTMGSAPNLAKAVRMFAQEGSPVVMVAAQYRLNGFGFLSVTELEEHEGANTGMYGIRDQQQALGWVQRNIQMFGGDRDRVTVFGQSSGGTSVMALLASAASKGLFSAAMSLSGSPNVSAALETQQLQHASVVTSLGCGGYSLKSDRLVCMRNASASAVVAALPRGPDHGPGTEINPSWSEDNIFGIISTSDGAREAAIAAVDGTTVTKPILEALATPSVGVDVPLIVSTMAQEGGLLPRDWVGLMSPERFTDFLTKRFSQGWGPEFGKKLAEMYGADVADGPQKAYDTMAADQGVTCGNQALAGAAADGFRSPVYSLYNEAYGNELMYAYHGYDLELATTKDTAVGAELRKLWYEFAATGAVAAWEPVSRGTADLNTTAIRFLPNGSTVVAPHWRSEYCSFWKKNGFGQQFWWSN